MAIKYNPSPLPAQQKLNFNINTFYGVNVTGNANGGEFTDCKNMSSDNYPYASPRQSKEVIAEGIQNPQKLLFCGDKLSYIAGGKLNVKNGDAFDEIDDVGTVTSAVDFNNQKMLFYPSDMVYDYENGDVTKTCKYLTVLPGSYTQEGEHSTDVYNDVDLIWRGSGYNNTIAATFVIKDNDNDNYIYPGETGKLTEDGKPIYNAISISVSGNSNRFATSGSGDGYFMKLFVQGWYENEPLNPHGNYIVKFSKFDFGEPITFGGVAPSKLLVQVGYYYTQPTASSDTGVCTSICENQRDVDLENYKTNKFKLWISSSAYPSPNSRPNIAYACMDNNRVVAVEGNNFYASSLGSYIDWTDFVDADGNPNETGAYAEELYSYGDFTGIIKYNSSVVITKADLTYICYGNKPPYRINEVCNTGCINGDTIAEVDGYLYWLGRDGVYRFGGGIPKLISDKIGSDFASGVACGNGHKYYICLKDKNGSYKLYVYDTGYGVWHIEDDRQYVSLTAKDGFVYGLTADGHILKFESGSERVKWEFTTSDYDFGTEYTKNIAKIYCRLKLYGQSYVDLYIRTNKQPWYKFANFKAEGVSVFQAKAKLKKCDYFTLKFVGCGEAEIMDIYADTFVGSQKHRCGDKLSVFRKG